VAVAVVVLAVGIAVVGLAWRDLTTVWALRLRGVHTQAVMTYEDFEGTGWTHLEVGFTTPDGLDAAAVIVREGEVTASTGELVSIVYDPNDPTRARLASDVQAGALVIEVVTGVIAFVGDSPASDSGLTIAAIGLVVVLVGLWKLAVATRPVRRLRSIVMHPARIEAMRLWLRKRKPGNKALLGPAEADEGDWLEFDLRPGQDLDGLIGVDAGARVEVLGGSGRDTDWYVIRVPDGRLLWPAEAATRIVGSRVNLAAFQSTSPAPPATLTAVAIPTTPPTPEAQDREPSLSCLLYLSANEFLQGETYGIYSRNLGATILAAGFLSLRDLGCIQLDYSGPANPPKPYPWVEEVVKVTLLRRVDLSGVPSGILDALRPWCEPVTEAASRMNDGAGVHGESMRLAAEQELIALGFVHRPARPDSDHARGLRAVARQLLVDPNGPSGVNPYEAIAALKDARAQGLRRWQQFQTTEPPLFRALMRACQWATEPEPD
jgi:hypothetical protein